MTQVREWRIQSDQYQRKVRCRWDGI